MVDYTMGRNRLKKEQHGQYDIVKTTYLAWNYGIVVAEKRDIDALFTNPDW